MYIKLILLFIIAVQGNDDWIPGKSKYVDDAAKWTELHREYLTRSPYVFRQHMETKCRIVKECCPDQLKNLFNVINENTLEQTCSGVRGSDLFDSQSSTCHSFVTILNDIKQTVEWTKGEEVTNIPSLIYRFKDWRSKMATACSIDELTAYFCEPDNAVYLQSCTEKVLRMVDRDTMGDTYDKFVNYIKSDYNTLIDRVSVAFHESSSFIY